MASAKITSLDLLTIYMKMLFETISNFYGSITRIGISSPRVPASKEIHNKQKVYKPMKACKNSNTNLMEGPNLAVESS